jgi:CMP-N-acetylneuraminic acid synthetase
MKKVIAVIPVKSISERVSSKNFREFFDGDSLFDLLIKKLLKSSQIDKIYISSNELSVKQKVENLGCHFIQREEKFCNNNIPWSDVIAHIAESIPEDNNTAIAWCHSTSPLFEDYDKAINMYKKSILDGKYDGLITVAELSEFIVSEKRQPINYSWGPWHRYSQFLEKMYTITYALFIASKGEMIKNRYVISKNPNFYIVPPIQALDIDSEYDFKLGQLLMKNKEYFKDD